LDTRKTQKTTIIVNADTNRRLSALVKELKFRNREQALLALIQTQKDKLIPFVNYETVFNSPAPVIIIGEPYTRKTYSIKSLVPKIKGSLLVIDTHSEYQELEIYNEEGKVVNTIPLEITSISNTSINFNNGQRLRFVPNSNPYESKAQIMSLFLNLHSQREQLKGLTIIIDEAHRYSKIDLLRSFIAEARKFNIKVILITSDYQRFSGLGYFLRPAPPKAEVSQ